MTFKDKLSFVRQNMKKNRSRVFMTVLATAMGCAFLIVLASVGFGLQRSVVQQITGDGLLTEISVHGKSLDGNYYPLADKDLAGLKAVKNVKAVTHKQFIQQNIQFYWNEFEASAPAVAVDFEEEAKAGLELSAGGLPTAEHEVIAGFHFASALKGYKEKDENIMTQNNAEMIGKTIEMEASQWEGGKQLIKRFPVTVVGIAKKPTKEWIKDTNLSISGSMLQQIEEFTKTIRGIQLPQQTEQEQQGTGSEQNGSEAVQQMKDELDISKPRSYDNVNVYAKDAKNVKNISDEINSNGYTSYSIANELEQINVFFLVLKIGLIFVGTIAILIASIGIYNTMTMAVTERSQDIGIMKAIGAHPSTIKNIFLIESSYIGLQGAVVGTIVAYGISYVVNIALPFVILNFAKESSPEGLIFSYIPWSLSLLCIAISFGVAVLSGVRPARRATQVDVLKALRRDI
ncbi:ABC transporter permease [Paenibacillus eucommiae]|uniref:Acetoin utilization transport system permease protein n=1 Tax=Paenibacillus eucommiae TaxID=1355755 RepID=A0ABS4ING9_9BACL|nr:FtsX-like permease family protein [Paenibacillus eucommiae]MBP1989089.1 acetoin utilization transport system permease protein [Paenibacillus eucommiae]